jgi:crotonobetainyl-CoA:carnitine CoA-transferase CaiB-like acyl-CoA transferase
VRTDRPPPLLGQHTEEVLQEVLGWDASKVAQLKEGKVL